MRSEAQDSQPPPLSTWRLGVSSADERNANVVGQGQRPGPVCRDVSGQVSRWPRSMRGKEKNLRRRREQRSTTTGRTNLETCTRMRLAASEGTSIAKRPLQPVTLSCIHQQLDTTSWPSAVDLVLNIQVFVLFS